MSPPAATKRTARSPGESRATCGAAPRSSLITTPPKPRSPRSRPVTIRVRERGRGAGVDARVDRRRHHHERDAGPRPRPERRQVRVVGGGDGVGDAGGGVGVAGDPAQAGEVLDRDVDAGGRHAAGEGEPVRRDGARAWSRTRGRGRRSAGSRRRRRHGVEHRREVDVDPGRAQLGAPLPWRRALQGAPATACPGDGASGCGEARALQPLDQPALLVGGDEQPDARRGEACAVAR